jgi:PAS domain S-box-containing protein
MQAPTSPAADDGLSTAPAGSPGKPDHAISTTVLAVSAKLQEEFRTLYETSKEMVVILDLDGRLVFASRAFRSALGFGEEPMHGISLFDLVHPYDHAACQAWLRNKRRRGAAGARDPARPPRPTDGREVPVEGSAARAASTAVAWRLPARESSSDLTEQERAADASSGRVATCFHLLSQHAPLRRVHH